MTPTISASSAASVPTPQSSVSDPSEYLHQYFRTGVTKRLQFSDPEVDAALLAEQKEFDTQKRVDLLRKAQSLIMQRAPVATDGDEPIPAAALVRDVAGRVLEANRALPVANAAGAIVGSISPQTMASVLLRRGDRQPA